MAAGPARPRRYRSSGGSSRSRGLVRPPPTFIAMPITTTTAARPSTTATSPPMPLLLKIFTPGDQHEPPEHRRQAEHLRAEGEVQRPQQRAEQRDDDRDVAERFEQFGHAGTVALNAWQKRSHKRRLLSSSKRTRAVMYFPTCAPAPSVLKSSARREKFSARRDSKSQHHPRATAGAERDQGTRPDGAVWRHVLRAGDQSDRGKPARRDRQVTGAPRASPRAAPARGASVKPS